MVAVVGCLAAALAGAGSGEVLDDESVGHCCLWRGSGLMCCLMCV